MLQKKANKKQKIQKRRSWSLCFMVSSCCATVALNRRSKSLLALWAFRSSSCSPWAWTLFWDSFDSVFIFIFDFDLWFLILIVLPTLHPTNKFDNRNKRMPRVGETPAVHAPSPRLHWGKQSQLRASQVYRSQDTAAPKSPKVYRHVLHLKSRLKGWKTVSTSRTSIYDLETVLLVVHPLHRTIFFFKLLKICLWPSACFAACLPQLWQHFRSLLLLVPFLTEPQFWLSRHFTDCQGSSLTPTVYKACNILKQEHLESVA